MTFPVEKSAANTTQTSNATDWGSQNMPSGIVAGDTLLALVASDGGSSTFTFTGGWTKLLDGDEGSEGSVIIGFAYKKAVGSDTLSFSSSQSQQGVIRVIRIDTAADPATDPPEIGAVTKSASATPNVGLITPTGGAKDYKFYSMCGHDRNRPFTSAPTDYQANDASVISGGGNGAHLAWGDRDVNASTQDPDNFTFELSDGAATVVIVVHPAADGDITLTSDPGALILTGASAALAQGLAATPGALILTGAAADLTQQATLQADPGSLLLTGAAANLAQALAATPGTLLVTGGEATLKVSRLLQADPGVLQLTGADAALAIGLVSAPGALLFTGAEATLSVSRLLQADPGALLFTGAEADLIQTGAPLIVRRGGVRFLLEPDPEIREQKVIELKALIKPRITPKTASREPQEPQESLLAMVSGATARMTPSQQTRVERLLEQTGISLDELLILLQ